MIFQIAAVAAAATAGIAWWWRRAINKQAAALDNVADGIVFLRKSAGVMPRMVPVGRTDERDAQFKDVTAELEASGFRMLGDVEEYKADGSLAGVVRWFASTDGHVCGWFGMTSNGVVLLLLSEDAGDVFTTTIRSAPAPGVTRPETIRRNDVGLDATIAEAISVHRRELEAMSEPIAVRDLPEALACLRRMTEHLGAWRSGQEPVSLLESDVRNITHDYYDAVGETVTTLVNLKEWKPA